MKILENFYPSPNPKSETHEQVEVSLADLEGGNKSLPEQEMSEKNTAK